MIKRSEPLQSRPYQVYRLYDKQDVLLWVGSSFQVNTRLSEHRRCPWGKDISRVTRETYPNQQAAHIAEDYAIIHEMPLHNKQRRWSLRDKAGCAYPAPVFGENYLTLPEIRRRQLQNQNPIQKPDMPGGTWLQ
jgi:hypothetical protein